MPTIFQASCNHCLFASDIFPAEYGAVFVDKPASERINSVVAGAVMFDDAKEAEVAEQGDPRLVVLAHPVESAILAETGFTWITVAWAGRYVRVRRVVCRSCGTLFEVRRLTCPIALGCMVGSIVGLTVGISYGIWERSFCFGFWAANGMALGFWATAFMAGSSYTRLRFKARAKAIDGPYHCPNCGSRRYVGIETRRSFPCPKCGECAMRVRSVGFS
jgi:ssDNA-binding Zn-finger/Zn-ribbon topoisomerase 1